MATAWPTIPAGFEPCGLRKGIPFAETGDSRGIAEGNPRMVSLPPVHGSARVMPFVETHASPGDNAAAPGEAPAIGFPAIVLHRMRGVP
jgi:hypothetical protein